MRSVWITVLSSFSWMSIVASDNLCQPNSKNEFIFSVNFHSPGRMGEFQVDGCNGNSPVLAVKRGETYTLVQDNITNWMHPLGLAYYPDGAHGFQQFEEVPELEYPTPEDCNQEQFKCNPGGNVKQAPLYGIDGVYETFDDWNNGVTGGLDVYEPAFKLPQDQWTDHKYSVRINVPLESKTKEFFYFCHIHSGMSGLILVTDPVENANSLVQKFDPKTYYKQSDTFDTNCGTSDVSLFHNSKSIFCPGQNFLCKTRHNKEFSECMEAIGCKMNYEMRVEEDSNPLVVFMHQMIPHHVNAVNMARIALKHAEEAVGYDDEDLDVPGLLREIINKQNEQIQEMENWLKRHKDRKTVPQYCVPPQLHSGDSSCNRNTLTIVIALAFFVVNINM
eukprot:GFUD01013378.1.p1 GENE.GFUD01013378.1~~GFUD01013378.1.p1  ORF type:complete len:390 (-),score=85.04 GFUD01013378.1:12-1181(-)